MPDGDVSAGADDDDRERESEFHCLPVVLSRGRILADRLAWPRRTLPRWATTITVESVDRRWATRRRVVAAVVALMLTAAVVASVARPVSAACPALSAATRLMRIDRPGAGLSLLRRVTVVLLPNSLRNVSSVQ